MSAISGGPAFPNPDREDKRGVDGMTLRDYFAGAVLSGLMANDRFLSHADSIGQPVSGHLRALIAKMAYEVADVLLQERQK